ncbi:MAG: TVP38/TMEM64 family protein [Candidatus Binatia bacterium]
MIKAPSRGNKRLINRWLVLLVLVALPAAWHFTPLRTWVDFETVARWQQSVRESAAAPYLIVGAYLAGALVFFPVTLLSLVTVFTFGAAVGGAYSLMGWLLSAVLGYGIGRGLGQDLLWDMAGPRFRRLELEARRHGFLTVLIMRLLPVAPFTLVNLFIGASRIRFRDFFLGSLVGRVPGLVALVLFTHQLEYALRAPGLASLLFLGVAVLLMLACLWIPRHFQTKRRTTDLSADKKTG